MLRQSEKITALYCRVNGGEGRDMAQTALLNQQELVTRYAIENGFTNLHIYADSGYSGFNFERIEFQRMIQDIEAGKVQSLVIKDLSRIGRNYMDCGAFIEEFLPLHDVALHSVQDGPYLQQEIALQRQCITAITALYHKRGGRG